LSHLSIIRPTKLLQHTRPCRVCCNVFVPTNLFSVYAERTSTLSVVPRLCRNGMPCATPCNTRICTTAWPPQAYRPAVTVMAVVVVAATAVPARRWIRACALPPPVGPPPVGGVRPGTDTGASLGMVQGAAPTRILAHLRPGCARPYRPQWRPRPAEDTAPRRLVRWGRL